MKNEKGITIISLVITVVVLMILLSIGTMTGLSAIKSSKYVKFKTELEIMQAHIDLLNEEYKEQLKEAKETGIEFNEVGKEISQINIEGEPSLSFEGAQENNRTGYRYYDKQTLEKLDIVDLEREFLVDLDRRKIIAIGGFEYEGRKYYTIEQIKGTLELEKNEKGEVTFNTSYKKNEDSTFTINLSNIKCSKYVKKYTIKYKMQDENDYKIIETNITETNYSFNVEQPGTYNIKIIDAADFEKEVVIQITDTTQNIEN